MAVTQAGGFLPYPVLANKAEIGLRLAAVQPAPSIIRRSRCIGGRGLSGVSIGAGGADWWCKCVRRRGGGGGVI